MLQDYRDARSEQHESSNQMMSPLFWPPSDTVAWSDTVMDLGELADLNWSGENSEDLLFGVMGNH